jgi:hypothetical protein
VGKYYSELTKETNKGRRSEDAPGGFIHPPGALCDLLYLVPGIAKEQWLKK